MKLSTITQIVEAILSDESMPISARKTIANDATIYLKTALFCEYQGEKEAMKYFKGNHSMDEYKEFLTSVVAPEDANGKDL